MPEPAEPAPAATPPRYVYRATVATVLLLIASAVASVLLYTEGTRGAATVAIITAVLAAFVAGVTIVCMRQDAIRQDLARLSDRLRADRAVALDILAELRESSSRRAALAEQLHELRTGALAIADRVEQNAAYHIAVESQKAMRHADYLFSQAMKEIENSNASTVRLDRVQEQIGMLAAQQETLAELVATGATVTLDVSNGDVYELGKRVGRDEARRELGHDPTP